MKRFAFACALVLIFAVSSNAERGQQGCVHTLTSQWGMRRSYFEPMSIASTGQPASATVGTAFSQDLLSIWTISCGVAPYTFSIGAGSLPPGLTLSSSGVVSGTPTTAGSYSATIVVVDSANNWEGDVELALGIPSGPRIVEGSLPPGLRLTSDGKIEGVPSAPGIYKFTVMLEDAKGLKTYRSYSLEVKPSAQVL